MERLAHHAARIGALLAGYGPSGIVALAIAELFYKFHSFTLEGVAFLATWYVADALLERPLKAIRARGRGLIGQMGR
jgi:hypothetical protein